MTTDEPFPAPHLFGDEINLFTAYLKESKSYFEFGSGGSTCLAVQLGIPSIVSVESDINWINKLRTFQVVKDKVQFHYIDIDANPDNWGYPKTLNKISNWHYYSGVITPYNPDLIFVDGRFRVACCLRSWLIMSEDSFLMIHDYKDRTQYHIIEQFFELVESLNTLYVFRKKADVDIRLVYSTLDKYIHDTR
jgi:hypothetical protein